MIARRFTKMYKDIYDGITNVVRKSKQRELLDIVKSNSKNNLDELDRNIIELVNVDIDFKGGLFEKKRIQSAWTNPCQPLSNPPAIPAV